MREKKYHIVIEGNGVKIDKTIFEKLTHKILILLADYVVEKKFNPPTHRDDCGEIR